ncbi:hypothetical protein KPH14_005787 [Odynerus spinipes]|uniref:DUF4776 domain-containing protein n=1 Tax=Odynerus spinipes TaxID=1348599 RepID=A0AAD9RCE1_9HYME|nr:hypothetical protein KPH14_005787 [Odynerus spinipes]
MNKRSPTEANNSLKLAGSSARLPMNDPAFEDLTFAEKLNTQTKSNMKKGNRRRLRGGGSGDDYYPGTSTPIDSDENIEFNWYGDKVTKEYRLEGGGREYDLPGCLCTGASSLYRKPEDAAKEGSCKPRSKSLETAKPGCTCAGQDPPIWQKDGPTCNKKPCTGVDCLLRAFKEAQEFVDSLGRVPGLEGLGLMDPSESPFFGRDIDKDYLTEEEQAEKRAQAIAAQFPSPNPQCTAPCNLNVGPAYRFDTGISSASVPYSTATPLTIAVPGRTGVVREAVPTLPDSGSTVVYSKPKKKEEKREEKIDKLKELDVAPSAPMEIDLGPCGEPKCKSRRKRGTDNVETSETAEHPHKRSATQLKTATTGAVLPKTSSRVTDRGRQQRMVKTGVPGPAGDRNAKPPAMRVSKRVMRYVYSIGDVYPGVHYGHKNCIDVRMRVPANMGWLWNSNSTLYNLKPRIGWKPGAIGKYLSALLREAKAGSLNDSRPRSVPSRSRRGKAYRSMSFSSVKKLQAKKEGEEETEPPPTLHIHRKDGTYYVTMYPIKQETMDMPKLEEPMKPLQFKIVKNKDDESMASSSTASDMEIEFSPPAAVNRYRKKPDVVHIETQVKQQEILDAMKITDVARRDKKLKKEKKLKK